MMMYQVLDEWVEIGGDGTTVLGRSATAAGGSMVEEPGGAYGAYAVDLEAYNPHTHRIIGCAMRVYGLLGRGFPESIYQRALAIELEREGVVAQREVETPIYFRGQHIGTRRVDFLAAGPLPDQPILVELKATADLTDSYFAQIINYLEAYRLHVGLLLNFGSPALQYRRFVKTSFAT